MADSPDTTHNTSVETPAITAPLEEVTALHAPSNVRSDPTVRRFRLTVAEGPAAGTTRESSADRCAIGSHELNDLVLSDPTVSRFHCEVRIDPEGPRVLDLKSRNGTFVDGVQVHDAMLHPGAVLRLGSAAVRFDWGAERNRVPVSTASRFGALVGSSVAMRAAIERLERAAATEATVLLEGETGTGKGRAAEAVHKASSRAGGPLIVVDCGAIPANLLESELFGHEKGSFTGAHERRIGAFEDASGGTLFLDEIGELPQELQPKLLRALENREVRRVGANRFVPVDFRLIAATNRDLRAEVNAGRFRPDLYFRLAVVKVPLPPLRDRVEDIPAILDELLLQLRVPAAAQTRLKHPRFLAQLQRGAWPGNVRELRNHVEQALVFADEPSVEPAGAGAAAPITGSGSLLPYTEAKKAAQDAWERQYLTDLLARFQGKVAQAAQAAGVDRVYLYRLLRRQGIKPGE